jgi:predicted SAM-dependent methyltransferase
MNDGKRFLNLGCGAKVSVVGNWTDVDQSSPVKGVLTMNILSGLDFPENTFDVVYSSHFVEHLDLKQLDRVLKEVFRVLKPRGIIRVATPDLEELVNSYTKYLDELKSGPDLLVEKKYDWIRTELFDQIVRDKSGGDMVDTMNNAQGEMSKFLFDRFGLAFSEIASGKPTIPKGGISNKFKGRSPLEVLKRITNYLSRLITSMVSSKAAKIGLFRMSGEVHRYMHDAYSLDRAFTQAGFSEAKVMSAFDSDIENWASYGLDSNGTVGHGPTALFMEAHKIAERRVKD